MTRDEELFGNLALEANLIRRHDLARALSVQEAEPRGQKRSIGEILVSLGLLSDADVRNILHVQALMVVADPDIQFMIDVAQTGLAGESQMKECLQALKAESHRRPLADIMVERKVLNRTQKDRLLKEASHHHGDHSKLVAAIRESEGNHSDTDALLALRKAQVKDARKLVREGVRSLVHLGILSHMVHHQGDAYTVKQLVNALDEDKRPVQRAVSDLVKINILQEERTWRGSRYSFSQNADIRIRVEILLLCFNDPMHRAEMFALLLEKK